MSDRWRKGWQVLNFSPTMICRCLWELVIILLILEPKRKGRHNLSRRSRSLRSPCRSERNYAQTEIQDNRLVEEFNEKDFPSRVGILGAKEKLPGPGISLTYNFTR